MLEIMNKWLALLEFNSFIIGMFTGLVFALFIAINARKFGRRTGAKEETQRLQPVIDELELGLKAREDELTEVQRTLAVTETRLVEQQ